MNFAGAVAICHTPFDSGKSAAVAASDHAARQVTKLYELADLLKAAEAKLDEIKLGRAAFDTLADQSVYLSDMRSTGVAISVIADAWQAELDGEEG